MIKTQQLNKLFLEWKEVRFSYGTSFSEDGIINEELWNEAKRKIGSHDDGPDALEMAVRICKLEAGQRKIRWLDLNGEDDDDDIDYDRPTQDPNERDYGSQYDDTNDGEDD